MQSVAFEADSITAGRIGVTFLQPTDKPRLNEPVGFLLLILGVGGALGLASHYPFDPSWNTAEVGDGFRNLIGKPGAYGSDLALQVLGAAAYLLPVFVLVNGWCWIRSTPTKRPVEYLIGSTCFLLTTCTGLALSPLSPNRLGPSIHIVQQPCKLFDTTWIPATNLLISL